MPDQNDVSGVIDPAAPAGGDNIQPDAQGGGTPETQARDENRIPHSRVEQMIASRIERERKAWEEKELAPLRSRAQQQDEMQKRMVEAELARLEKMGWYQPKAPEPITRDVFEKMLNERLTAAEKQRREEQYQMYYSDRITSGWKEVQRKYPELAKLQVYQNGVLSAYAENPRRDFVDIADEMAKQLEGYGAALTEAKARDREGRFRPDKRVVPSGGGAAGGSGSGGKEKLGVAAKLQARLRASRESE